MNVGVAWTNIMNRMFGGSNQRFLDVMDHQLNAMTTQLSVKDNQLSAMTTQLTAKDDQLRQLYQQLLDAKDAVAAAEARATHFNVHCRKFQSMVFANEASRDIRGALEWMARMIYKDNIADPTRGFPGVQSILDKYVLSDALFQAELDKVATKFHTDNARDALHPELGCASTHILDTMKRRFKAIFDTVSKEHHGSDARLRVPHSKFPCQGDRLVLCAIFEYYGFPYEILEDADALDVNGD